MKFLAQLGYIIPGNFVGWRIRTIDKSHDVSGIFGHPVIPDDCVLDNAEPVVSGLGITIEHPQGPYCVPVVTNDSRLRTAVFEIEKTARAKFRVLRYVGELKIRAKEVSLE